MNKLADGNNTHAHVLLICLVSFTFTYLRHINIIIEVCLLQINLFSAHILLPAIIMWLIQTNKLEFTLRIHIVHTRLKHLSVVYKKQKLKLRIKIADAICFILNTTLRTMLSKKPKKMFHSFQTYIKMTNRKFNQTKQ